MMIKLLTALLLYTSQNAYANRAVMEALPTTFNAVTIGTTTPQLLVNTTFYSGVIPTVSVKAASNVVVGADKCVIYSTGSMGCSGSISGNGSQITGIFPDYFISSNTVTGSTATVSTVGTVFSTYPYVSGSISIGGRYEFECKFRSGTAPGTPLAGVYLDGVAIQTENDTAANASQIVRARVTLTQTGKAQFDGDFNTANISYTNSITDTSFDESSAHTFNCRASRASGGAIQFVWMRVRKL